MSSQFVLSCQVVGAHDVHDEADGGTAQVKASVEAVGECGKIVLGALAVLQRVERAGQGRLEVAQHGVDPLECGQVTRLEGTHDHWRVHTAGVGDCGKAALTGHTHLRRQGGLGPLADGRQREAAHQTELEVQRAAALVERDCHHERHLVFGAPGPDLPSARSPPR